MQTFNWIKSKDMIERCVVERTVTHVKKTKVLTQMKRYGWLVIPIVWMAVIFYASAMPYQDQNIQPLMRERLDLSGLEPILEQISFSYNQREVSLATHGVYGMIEFFLRKGAHLFIFYVLFILWFIALRNIRINRTSSYLLAIGLSISYAFFDEWHQGLTPNRTPYIGDVVIDAVGVFLACLTVWLVSARHKKKHQRREW